MSACADDADPGDNTAALATPGCSSLCRSGEVCVDGQCQAVGPTKTCEAATQPAGTLYVDQAYGKADSDGSSSKPFTRIGDALLAAKGGATISVADGDYDEALTVDKDVAIRCACADKVRIGAVEVREPAAPAPQPPSLTVSIEGCHIRPAAPPTCTGTAGGVGLRATSSLPLVLLLRDSRVSGWCTGVYFSAVASSASALCVNRSEVSDNGVGVDVQQAPMIGVAQPADCAGLEGVAVRASSLSSNADFGLRTRQATRGVALIGNVVADNGKRGSGAGEGYGVYLGDMESALVRFNRFLGNQSRGLALRNEATALSPTKIVIDRNEVGGNVGAGIALHKLSAAKSVSVTGNVVMSTRADPSSGDGDGVQITTLDGTAFDVDVSGNIIDGCARDGVFIDGAGGSVSRNTLSGNGGYGVRLQSSVAVLGAGSGDDNTYRSNAAGQVDPKSVGARVGSLPIPLL